MIGQGTVPRIAAMLAAGLLFASTQAEAEGCKLATMEMPVRIVNSRVMTTVRINGTEVPMMVDSGAAFSFLTPAAAAQLNLKLTYMPFGMRVRGWTGEVETRATTVKQLQFLSGEIPDVEFIVGGTEPGAGAMGLLGQNLLGFTDIEYDLAHGMIRYVFAEGDCRDRNMAYWAGGKAVSEIPLRRPPDKRPFLTYSVAQVNGTRQRVMFDTGAPQSMLSLTAAHEAHIADADMKPGGSMWGAGSGELKTWNAPLESFELGGEKVSNIRIQVADHEMTDNDMALGLDFFLAHRIYVSKAQHKMYFTYNGGGIFAQSVAAPSDAGMAADASVEQPADADGYARRGGAFAARKDLPHALADLDKACELSPQTADYFLQRARVLEAMKLGARALADIETALKLDPSLADARMKRAWFRSTSRDRDGALEDLKTLDQALAPQAHMRAELARLYLRLGLPAQALPQLNAWVPTHKNDAGLDDVLNARCRLRMQLNTELDLALKDCNDALKDKPQNADYFDSRAWVHLRRSELREALADWDQSLKIKPDAAWPLYGRGLARIKTGDAANGQADIDAARKMQPAIDAEMKRYGLLDSAIDGTR